MLEGCLSLGKARVNVEVERPRAVVLDGQDATRRAAADRGRRAATPASSSTSSTISTAC